MALYDSLKNLIAGATLFADTPLGTINAFGGSTAPDGWLLCQGQAISRTEYADLFAVIGTAFGAGDGSTTFNVPDMKGKVLAGYNVNETEFNALGKTGGEKTHTLTVSEIPSHYHNIRLQYGAVASTSYPPGSSYSQASGDAGYYGAKQIIQSAGGGQAHNNLQPYETVNFIIKAVQAALPADIISAVEDLLDSKDLLTWG